VSQAPRTGSVAGLDIPLALPIGAGWVEPAGTRQVIFPYDGTVIAEAPEGSAALATSAIDAALAARREVESVPAYARREVCLHVAAAVDAARPALERLLVLETGKPLVDCRVEVDRTVHTWRAAAEEVGRIHGETVPLDVLPNGTGLIGFWQRKPIGVVVGIAGYNYPLLLASHKLSPALAAGCPVVVKPAEPTPLATLWLLARVREALQGASAPVVAAQLVTGGAEVGQALTTDRRIGAVSFTGSAAVGHLIARAAAPTKVLLELGSNAALVVAADADLDAAAGAVVRGGYYASGQACIAVQRVIVVESVREPFLARLAEVVPRIVVGDPRDEATRVAPLIDARTTSRVAEWISRAVAAGGRLVCGGVGADGRLLPTVLMDVPDDEPVWAEEVFGPVVAVRSVPDVETAFALVNASRYGLHASVYTASLATAMAALDTLEVGGVVVNEVPGFRSDVMPYGGVKDSGIGREGPRFAIEELTVTRMAVIAPSPRRL
jgi:acyl-CoA reductase-like NAD-dependent aldehyde dehydrogenase